MERDIKRAWYLLLIFCTVSFSLSLQEAEKKALESFRELKIEKIQQRKKTYERLEKFGKFLPTINLEASFNISKKQSFSFSIPSVPPQDFVFQKGSYSKFTLQISQTLLSLPYFKEYEIAKILESSQKYMVKEKELRVLYQVREAYVNALKAQSVVDIYKKHLERVEAHLRDVEELYKEGMVAFKDVLETKVKLYEVKEKLTTAEANYQKALEYLSYLTGEDIDSLEDLSPEAYEDLSEIPEEELVERLRRNRPVLKFLRENTVASKEAVELAKSYFYPQVVLEAFFQRTEESDLFPKSRYLITFAFRWNLLSGLRKFRALEISKLSYRQTLDRYRDTEEKLKLELKNTLEDIKSAKAKIELAKKQLEDAKEHLRIAVEKYKAGLGTNTEVLDAQSYLTTAESTLRISRYDLLIKIFKLYEVIGYER